MKNVLLVFGSIIVIIIVIGLTWYNSSYKGPSYYVRVHGEDTHVNKKYIYSRGEGSTQYTYLLKGYDQRGESKELKLNTLDKIKENTYLEVFPNSKGEVISTVERKRSEVPKNALENLE
ncbi:YxeA family protein [Lactococcus garvieae]|jgi:uncharacterized protein (TIGR01655 family)|uniref:YxeA family protein n=2 Tax=Lactococcus garvieae TaxID=1363 RepID=A0AAX3NDT2_9LACT|nr:YxeA family protein [Lactococcus garvieae]NHI69033.1 YxeA family protein [Lactococcus garvieae]NHJ07591.1 YxeA family protein [Lactococcus garvieae]WEA14433.1 YxeA family protein [Lactococcus garvieae]